MFRIPNPTRVLKALWLSASLLMVVVCANAASAQTAAFTYQGRLTDGGTPASGNYDLQFALFDSVSGGVQIGATQTSSSVSVSAGIFTVQLDFGANAFPGATRFLEIRARLVGTASYTTLAPRQQITSTPYAIRSLNASTADAVTVNGVPGGSGNYIQNQIGSAQVANFYISGGGTVGGSLTIFGKDAVYASLDSYNENFGSAVRGISNGIGVYGNAFIPGSAAIVARGTSWFSGDTTPLANSNTGSGTGIAIGSSTDLNYGYIFAKSSINQPQPLVLNHPGGNVGIGTTTPQATLHVNGAALVTIPGGPREVSLGTPNGETGIGIKGINNRADVRFDGQTLRLVAGGGTGPPPSTNGLAIDATSGNVAIGQVSSSATSVHVCLDFANRLAFCSSSLRYKEQVTPYGAGLDLIRRLRPISFTWKDIGTRDLGLGAEDVAKVEPMLVTHNDKGEIQGVKYDQLNVVVINAIKQQQEQIETLRAQNAALNTRLRALEKRSVRRRRP